MWNIRVLLFRNILSKPIAVLLLGLAFNCSASSEKTADEKYQRIIRNYFDVYIGHFEPKPKEQEVFNEASFPGGGFVVRQFKVERVISASSSEKQDFLEVRVPLDLTNKDKFTYKEGVTVTNNLETKIIEINRSETLSEAEWAQMRELKAQLRIKEYIVNILALEQKLNYDFSLVPETKYFFAVHKSKDGHFSLSENPSKLIPFGRGQFIDDIDFGKAP